MVKQKHKANIPCNKCTKRQSDIRLIPENLASLCKMLKKNQVLGRYLYLYDNYKSKDMRKRTLKKEVLELWKKLNFPFVSDNRL